MGRSRRAGRRVLPSAFNAAVLHRVGDGEGIPAQLAIGDATFWVATAGPTGQRLNPKAIGTTGRILLLDDPDDVFHHAVTAGATPHRTASRLPARVPGLVCRAVLRSKLQFRYPVSRRHAARRTGRPGVSSRKQRDSGYGYSAKGWQERRVDTFLL